MITVKFTYKKWKAFLIESPQVLRQAVLHKKNDYLEKLVEEVHEWDSHFLTESRLQKSPYLSRQRQLMVGDPSRPQDHLLGLANEALAISSQPQKTPPPLGGWRQKIFQSFLGKHESPLRRVSSVPLLVEPKGSEPRGLVAHLILKLCPGSGKIYPCPFQNPFFLIDDSFAQALKLALQWAGSQEDLRWPKDRDILWSLQSFSGDPLPSAGGNSIFLAFCVALHKLLGLHASSPFEAMALSATSQALQGPSSSTALLSPLESEWDGKALFERVLSKEERENIRSLAEIGAIQPKLLDEFRHLSERKVLHTVAVSHNQSGIPPLIEEQQGPWSIFRAQTVEEVILKIQKTQAPFLDVTKYNLEVLGALENRALHQTNFYQPLGLLKEMENPSEDSNPLVRWEEELLHGQSRHYQRCSVTEAFQYVFLGPDNTSGQFVVVGPPGSGKTTFLFHLAKEIGRGHLSLAQKAFVPVWISLSHWMEWACAENNPRYSLVEYLKKASGYPSSIAENHWQSWIDRGSLLLLLDGLDEIRGHKQEATFFQKCLLPLLEPSPWAIPLILTCRTLVFHHYQSPLKKLAIFTLGSFSPSDQRSYIQHFFQNSQNSSLAEFLGTSPSLQLLASNPLLLNMICYVTRERSSEDLPQTRGEFYEMAIRALLESSGEKAPISWPGHSPRSQIKRGVLERISGESLLAEPVKKFLSEEEITEIIKAELRENYTSHLEDWSGALLEDFTQNSGILRKDEPMAGKIYFFFHPTIQEFLAGCYLGQQIEKGKFSLKKLLSKKRYHPAWQEVFCFLSGRLSHPLPLVKGLSKKSEDDYFRHQLALSLRCAGEIPSAKLSSQEQKTLEKIKTTLTTTAFSLWWNHCKQNTHQTVSHIFALFPLLIQQGYKIFENKQPLLLIEKLTALLQSQNPHHRWKIAEALGRLTRHCPGHLLPSLWKALENQDGLVRWRALKALGEMESPGLSVIERTMTFLEDQDPSVQSCTAKALGEWGKKSAPALEALEGLLDHRDLEVQSSVALALGKIQEQRILNLEELMALAENSKPPLAIGALEALANRAIEGGGFLSRLVPFLSSPHWLLQRGSIRAFGNMGLPALPILPSLVEKLGDKNPFISREASLTIGKLGREAPKEVVSFLIHFMQGDSLFSARFSPSVSAHKDQPPPLLPAIFQTLRREGTLLLSGVARALGVMGERGLPLLSKLRAYLKSTQPLLRWLSIEIMIHFGAEGAEALPQLIGALSDSNSFVRAGAVQALGNLGEKGLPALSSLVEALGDGDFLVQWRAVEALEKMGEKFPDRVLLFLEKAFLEGKPSLKWKALKALGKLGAPTTICHCMEALNSRDVFLRKEALRGLEKMANQGMTALPAVIRALDDGDSHVRNQAGKTLYKWMETHVIFRKMGRWIAKEMGELYN